MNNVHPIFCEALAPFVPMAFCNSEPAPVVRECKVFAVTCYINGEPTELNVIAEDQHGAIRIDSEMLGIDPDDEPPAGTNFKASPINFLKAA